MPDTTDASETPARRPRKTRKPRVPEIPASPAPASIADAIAETAKGPKSVTVDGQTVQAHDLKQMIDADRYLSEKKAARNPLASLRLTSMSHSGAN